MKKWKIVLVDDDRNILDSLARILWRDDYELIKCESAVEAWNIIDGEKGQVDIVISDNKMPDMKGTDLLIAIKKKYPNVVRIMLTGQSEIEDAKKAINEGRVYRFLTKPCDPDEIILIIKDALALRDLFFENRKLLKHVKTIKSLEKEHSGITSLDTDDEGRIFIDEDENTTFDEYMKRYSGNTLVES